MRIELGLAPEFFEPLENEGGHAAGTQVNAPPAPPADVFVGPPSPQAVEVSPIVALPVDEGEPANVNPSAPTEGNGAQNPGEAAQAMAEQLSSPQFVPQDQELANTTAASLNSLAEAYTDETSAQLQPAIDHWLGIGQEILDSGSWQAPAPTTTSQTDPALARIQAQYAALGYTEEQIASRTSALLLFAQRSGVRLDDIRVAASAPGPSPMDWALANLPTMNVSGIVAFDRNSGGEGMGSGAVMSDDEVVSYLQSFEGFGGYDDEVVSVDLGGYIGGPGVSVNDMIDAMSPAPMYTPIEIAVGDLYAEYTMRDLPLYCFEYSERLRDQLEQTAPESHPVVIEYPSAEEHGMNHYVVQIDTPEGPRIIDLTADQFAILNGQDRVGPEMKTPEQMEIDMRERGFREGRIADMSQELEPEEGD